MSASHRRSGRFQEGQFLFLLPATEGSLFTLPAELNRRPGPVMATAVQDIIPLQPVVGTARTHARTHTHKLGEDAAG